MDRDVPIGCGDVAVFPGDIVVGDVAAELAEEVVEMTVCEDFVVERVKAGTLIIGLYPSTKDKHAQAFAVWCAEVGR